MQHTTAVYIVLMVDNLCLSCSSCGCIVNDSVFGTISVYRLSYDTCIICSCTKPFVMQYRAGPNSSSYREA